MMRSFRHEIFRNISLIIVSFGIFLPLTAPICLMAQIRSPAISPHGTWESMGPEGGTLTSLIQHPTDSDILYVTPMGYPGTIYRSMDKGTSWQALSQADQSVADMAIDPNNAAKIYIVDTNTFSKSNDGGVTWQYLYISGYYFDGISVDRHNGQILHAYGSYYGSTTGSLAYFRSTDAGRSWSPKNIIMNPEWGNIYSLKVDPDNSSIVYAAFYIYTGSGYSRKLYKSTDSGVNWTDITPPTVGQVYDIAIASSPQNTLFAVTYGRVYRSHDQGASWLVSSGYVYGVKITVDPNNGNTLYTGEYSSCYRSTDGGDTWTFINNGLHGNRTNDLIVDKGNSSNIFLVNESGFFKSVNSGDQWVQQNSGLVISRIKHLKHLSTSRHILFAGTENDGVHKTTQALGKAVVPSLVDWEILDDFKGDDITAMCPSPVSPDILYVTTQYG